MILFCFPIFQTRMYYTENKQLSEKYSQIKYVLENPLEILEFSKKELL